MNSSLQLYNGTTVSRNLSYEIDSGADVNCLGLGDIGSSSNCEGLEDGTGGGAVDAVSHKGVDGLAEIKMLNVTRFAEMNQSYAEVGDRMTNNVDGLVDNIAENYSRGELNATDILGCQELANNYASNLRTTGSLAYLDGAMACAGMDGNLNTSATIRLEDDGKEITGNLYSSELSGLRVNKTYYHEPGLANPSGVAPSRRFGANGDVWFRGSFRDITQNFTVISLTDVFTGESLNETNFTERDWESSNVSDLDGHLNELESIDDLVQDLENQSNDGLFGGIGSGNGLLGGLPGIPGIPNILTYGVLAVLALVAIVKVAGGGSGGGGTTIVSGGSD
jgi:hypothetical protein